MNYYKKYTPYLFLLPAVAVLIVFFFIPFFQTFGLSFFDYSSSIYNPTFNGVDNYIKLFKELLFSLIPITSSKVSYGLPVTLNIISLGRKRPNKVFVKA